jgi:hypothetical protein
VPGAEIGKTNRAGMTAVMVYTTRSSVMDVPTIFGSAPSARHKASEIAALRLSVNQWPIAGAMPSAGTKWGATDTMVTCRGSPGDVRLFVLGVKTPSTSTLVVRSLNSFNSGRVFAENCLGSVVRPP